MSARTLVAIGLFACACTEPTVENPAPSPSADSFAELRRLEERVAFERLALKKRLDQDFELPERVDTVCPDSLGQALKAPEMRWLVVRVNDARAEKRDLLQLRFTSQIESQELGALERFYTPGSSPALIKRPLRDEAAAREALSLLQGISSRPYAGVVHVTSFIPPQRVHKLGRRSAEWTPGWLFGSFVIHRIDDALALCGFPLEIKNDVAEAPLSRQLREETGHQLVLQLGRRVRSDVRARLPELHKSLTLPHPGGG